MTVIAGDCVRPFSRRLAIAYNFFTRPISVALQDPWRTAHVHVARLDGGAPLTEACMGRSILFTPGLWVHCGPYAPQNAWESCVPRTP